MFGSLQKRFLDLRGRPQAATRHRAQSMTSRVFGGLCPPQYEPSQPPHRHINLADPLPKRLRQVNARCVPQVVLPIRPHTNHLTEPVPLAADPVQLDHRLGVVGVAIARAFLPLDGGCRTACGSPSAVSPHSSDSRSAPTARCSNPMGMASVPSLSYDAQLCRVLKHAFRGSKSI